MKALLLFTPLLDRSLLVYRPPLRILRMTLTGTRHSSPLLSLKLTTGSEVFIRHVLTPALDTEAVQLVHHSISLVALKGVPHGSSTVGSK